MSTELDEFEWALLGCFFAALLAAAVGLGGVVARIARRTKGGRRLGTK